MRKVIIEILRPIEFDTLSSEAPLVNLHD
jgi:hypothetical protein